MADNWRINRGRSQKKSLNTSADCYVGNFPNFQKPTVLGYFSLDSHRSFNEDLTQLKYMHQPHEGKEIRFDLNSGIQQSIKKDETKDEKLDNVLRWILRNSSKLKDDKTKQDIKSMSTDFVCFRGLLTVLMCTPYEHQDGWIICATKWHNTIYLCASETEEKRQNRERATDKQKQFMAWGYKFEQYMTKDKPGYLPNVKSPVNEREEFCVTFRTRLSGHSVLFGAEMDGIQSDIEVCNLDGLTKAEFVELKTSRHIQSAKQNFTFQRYKLIKWWCQSFLVGIKTVTCGFRDDSGLVHELQDFSVKDLPKLAQGLWDPCVCMNFCAHFLDFVKSIVEEKNPETVWKFELVPGKEEVTFSEIPGPSRFSFLPEWFTESAGVV